MPATGSVPACASASAPAPAGLAAGDWAGIRAAWEANRHAAWPMEGGHRARNPGQQWQTEFDGRGFTTVPDAGGWTWGLSLLSYGFAGDEHAALDAAVVSVSGQRVAYEWDTSLTEWYVNDTRGLEHGFTLHERPTRGAAGCGGGDGGDGDSDGRGTSGGGDALIFELDVRGGLSAEVNPDGRSVRFRRDDGSDVLSYSGLVVYDADGREFPAHFEGVTDGLRLSVSESGARYPLTIDPIAQQAYLKASNPGSFDEFGQSVAISGDTLVVGATLEASNATGVNGDQSNNSLQNAGAAYVFVRNGGTWSQQAYLKASNTGSLDQFGRSVAISCDTIVVGAWLEDSNAVGVNGNQTDNNASASGAAFVFVRSGTTWTQQAYLKASNTNANDWFGLALSLSGDTLAVSAYKEASNATGVNGNQLSNSAAGSGAAYVFVRSGSTWSQQAYLKASNTDMDDNFGQALAVSGDTIVVGALGEDSNASGVDGDQGNNSIPRAGAAYVFARSGGIWAQQAYLKASTAGLAFEDFGISVSVSDNTVVVGAIGEDSNATGVDGNQGDDSAMNSGAAHVFVRNGVTWSQQAYLKASNTGAGDAFGNSVAVSGNTLVVGANGEDHLDLLGDTGAMYVFVRSGGTWSHLAYLQASNPGDNDQFGRSVAVSGDTALSAAFGEDSQASGVNGNQTDDSLGGAGAAYVFDLGLLPEPWAVSGAGVSGVSGVPALVGKGTLIGGDELCLTLSSAKPGSSAALILGLSALNVPFKGGTLVPAPDFVLAGLPVDAGGALVIRASWPSGVLSGVMFWLQEWIADPAGPAGLSASNGLLATVP